VILDLFSRIVVGWKLGETLEAALVVTALGNALARRQPPHGLIFHSDQGSQYRSEAVQKALTLLGANLSMSGRGNGYDNATAEAFFSTLKTEAFPNDQVFATKAQPRQELFEYIEVYYNNQRLHSSLDYQAPRQFETDFNRVIDKENGRPQGLDAAPEDRALLRTHLERRSCLAHGRRGRLAAACRPLPAQAQSEKSPGVRGTAVPRGYPQTRSTKHLRKPKIACPFCWGKYRYGNLTPAGR
jgi:integrase-like protein